MQIVFQDPYGSLSAKRMSVGQIIDEGLNDSGSRAFDPRPSATSASLGHALKEVGLESGASATAIRMSSRAASVRRIAIARALVLEPKFLILDEPTSALDVSVQAQIVDLLRELQRRHKLAYLFISHDLKVVRALANSI